MTEVVFVRTEYNYQSYSDMWRLVELSGFPWVYVKDFNLEKDYIGICPTVNGELRPHIDHRRSILNGPQWARLIHWNLERPDSGDYELSKITSEGVSNSTNEILKYVDYVWVSDRYWASLDPRLIYVPMGSDARLVSADLPWSMYDKIYDACTLSYNNHRRDRIYGALKQQIRMAPSSAWDQERDRILRSSRCMVYVHQTPMPIGAPLRMALASAYKLPVVSEQLGDPYPHRDDYDVLMAPYDQIVPRTLGALQGNLAELGENLYRKLCVEHPFRKCVLEGVERTLAAA